VPNIQVIRAKANRRARSKHLGFFGFHEDVRLGKFEQERHPDAQLDYGDDDDEGEPVFYDFGRVRSTSNANRDSDIGGLALSDDESAMTAEEDLDNTTSAGAKGGGAAANHVLESRYSGDGGHHSVNLTAVLSRRANLPRSHFQWM
jgi:hypothetical protein